MVLDSDVLIALLKSGVIDILQCMDEIEFITTEINYAEISKGAEASDFEGIVLKKVVNVAILNEPMALVKFAEFQKVIDAGESAVIALASLNGWHIAMHDRAGRKVATNELSKWRVHRLEDIIVDSVRSGCLSTEQANRSAKKLRNVNDYLLCFIEAGIQSILDDPEFGISIKPKSIGGVQT